MRAIVPLAAALPVVLAGCPQDTMDCTAELRWAVVVTVDSPDGLGVDAVEAGMGTARACEEFPFETDAGEDALTFGCPEQGAGTYFVRVTSGALTWTQSIRIDGDECHVQSPPAMLHFVLDPDTAD